MTDNLMTVNEVAEYLKVSKYTIYRWIKRGKICYTKIGGSLRFHKESLGIEKAATS